MKSKKINILGVNYTIEYKKFDDDKEFSVRNCSGYCNMMEKKIAICDMKTFPNYDGESEEYMRKYSNETLRHEITHAFLYESGLCSSSHQTDQGWAVDEEIVDWIAIQSPKLYKVFNDLNIID